MAAHPQQQNQGQGQRPRILRIGVILGGKIIEERLVRDRSEQVTIGQSAKNTFSVPLEGLPRSWPMFVPQQDGTYLMCFTDGMDGRISDASGGVYTLDQLRSQGARRQGEQWIVPLALTARGKIIVGDMTLLFQFVTEPPLQPKPHLPASVRGTLADRVDPYLAIILAVSLLFHGGFTIYFLLRDRVVDKGRAAEVYKRTFDQPVAVAEDVLKPPPIQESDEAAEPAEDEGDEEPEEETPDKQPEERDRGPSPEEKAARREKARMKAQEDVERALAAVTGSGKSDRGVATSGEHTIDESSVDAQLDRVKKEGSKVAVGGNKRTDLKGGGPNVGGSADDQRTGPGDVASGPERKVRKAKVDVGGATGDTSQTLTPADVTRKIRRVYMAGLVRCHKAALKTDPGAGGRVVLSFTVTASGRAAGGNASGFNSSVDSCIESQMRSWRFSPPRDEDGDTFDAEYRVTLALQPPG